MAGDLPPDPPRSQGSLGWTVWEPGGVDLDSNANPRGYPFPQNTAQDLEILVIFVSDGAEYFAQVIDRTPLLRGEDAIITDSRDDPDLVSYTRSGSHIEVTLDASLMYNPDAFRWRAGILAFHNDESSSTHVYDVLFDPIGRTIAWP